MVLQSRMIRQSMALLGKEEEGCPPSGKNTGGVGGHQLAGGFLMHEAESCVVGEDVGEVCRYRKNGYLGWGIKGGWQLENETTAAIFCMRFSRLHAQWKFEDHFTESRNAMTIFTLILEQRAAFGGRRCRLWRIGRGKFFETSGGCVGSSGQCFFAALTGAGLLCHSE